LRILLCQAAHLYPDLLRIHLLEANPWYNLFNNGLAALLPLRDYAMLY
jgi:hypothetical protein